jgi:hypothetical protein
MKKIVPALIAAASNKPSRQVPASLYAFEAELRRTVGGQKPGFGDGHGGVTTDSGPVDAKVADDCTSP